jgi:DNA-binding transcriptional MocR family regulator
MIYSERHDAVTGVLGKQIGTSIEITTAKAGMHLVARLPAAVDDLKIEWTNDFADSLQGIV